MRGSLLAGRVAIFRYVPHHQVEDSLRLGWLPTTVLAGTIHAEWSTMMAWLCGCPMSIPAGDGGR